MSKLGEIISRNEERIRTDWISDMAKSVQRADLISGSSWTSRRAIFCRPLSEGASRRPTTLTRPAWSSAREFLQDISASRARQGFTPCRDRDVRAFA